MSLLLSSRGGWEGGGGGLPPSPAAPRDFSDSVIYPPPTPTRPSLARPDSPGGLLSSLSPSPSLLCTSLSPSRSLAGARQPRPRCRAVATRRFFRRAPFQPPPHFYIHLNPSILNDGYFPSRSPASRARPQTVWILFRRRGARRRRRTNGPRSEGEGVPVRYFVCSSRFFIPYTRYLPIQVLLFAPSVVT